MDRLVVLSISWTREVRATLNLYCSGTQRTFHLFIFASKFVVFMMRFHFHDDPIYIWSAPSFITLLYCHGKICFAVMLGAMAIQ